MNANILLPKHVAIIMDGNRRWAKEHKLPIFEGHRIGEQKIEPVIDRAIELSIPYLTFWAFSTENWKRKEKEINFLMNLFRVVLEKKINKFHEKSVKINIIGDLSKFPSDIQKKTRNWIEKTKNNLRITVNIALNYGGRDEIIRAFDKMRTNSKHKAQNSKLNVIDFEKYLDTAGQPDPDLIIRTGGVKRLSGFMLWQAEYSELYFSDINWPDFTLEEFEKAVNYYMNCQRRFGS
jgi:undecaprenyl diphosphate synthase